MVWRAVIAEFIATLLLTFAACASTIPLPGTNAAAQSLIAGIVQGFTLAAMIGAIANTSGGHVNPAVTLALTVSGNMPLVDGLAYMLFQILGGIAGAAILRGVLTHVVTGPLGATALSQGISHFEGYVFEFIVTTILIFTVFGTAVDKDAEGNIKSLAPVPIGMALVAGVTIAFGFTGGSLNPARSFGPALVNHYWHAHYIYWFGPITAAILVALFYRFVLSTKPGGENDANPNTKPASAHSSASPHRRASTASDNHVPLQGISTQ